MNDEDAVPRSRFPDDEEGVPLSEEEGEPTMRKNGNLVGSGGEDSSEEEDDDDPEEARRIAEGFIAEDDEELDEEDETSRREKKRRRRKKRKQFEEDFEVDEDDLELLAENTGLARKKELHRLKRFRRGGSASPDPKSNSASQQRELAELFDDDDDDDEAPPGRRGADVDEDDDLPSVGRAIRNDVSRKHRPEVGYEDDGLDDFIEEDEDEEEMRDLDEEEREARRRERREEKRRARMSGSAADPAKAGIDREAWDEIHDIFGNGEDYYWALEEDDEDGLEIDKKAKMAYKDIFEPAQIAERMLTEEDDRIKRVDIPERMQLAIPGEEGLKLLERKLSDAELFEAARWASTRISPRCNAEYLDEAGLQARYRDEFLNCVRLMLAYMLNDLLEVPFLYQHRFDELEQVAFDPIEQRYKGIDLLTRRELYTLSGLGLKFKNLLARKEVLKETFERLDLGGSKAAPRPDGAEEDVEAAARREAETKSVDEQKRVFEDMLAEVSSLEEVSDLTEWLMMRYGQCMRDTQALLVNGGSGDLAADDMEGLTLNGESVGPIAPSGFKKPSMVGQYERVKATVVSEFARNFGISSVELAANINGAARRYIPEDQPVPPHEYAEQFVGVEWGTPTSEIALAKAKLLLVQEIGKDPLLKREIRQLFKDSAEINIEPTERGMVKIDDQHPYANFKFLRGKPVRTIPQQPAQYLQILQAEADLLIKLDIGLRDVVLSRFETHLYNNYASEGTGEVSEFWNGQRREIITAALKEHLVPLGRLWLKEWLREECRETLLRFCEQLMAKRVSMGPIMSRGMEARNRDPKIEEEERVPKVLAVSHGGGDPRKDTVAAVFLDERGRSREHASFDDLRPPTDKQLEQRQLELERTRGKATFTDHRADFIKLVKDRRPDVVVVGGWSARTAELRAIVRELVDEVHQQMCVDDELRDGGEHLLIDTVTCYDDVARIYQHSKRAAEEFPELSELGRYCLALARYAQSPVNEFAALGPDLTAVILDPHQRLLPQDRLKLHFERAICSVVNEVGVEINQAMASPYLQAMLQYVAGLGPRKARALVNAIGVKLEGTLINREVLVKRDIVTFHVWTNCVSFLRIDQDLLLEADGDDVPDALDCTRIHPEDYDFPRKMAADALNKHEEDLEGEHYSMPCRELMEDADPAGKLGTLDLDNYAQMLYERKGLKKRATLHSCKTELIKPYDDLRPKQALPTPDEILTMFTGETSKTLDKSFVVPVEVMGIQRPFRDQENPNMDRPAAVRCRLDSGIEGSIEAQYTSDDYVDGPGAPRLGDRFQPGQTLDAIVTDIDKINCRVQLSIRPWDLSQRYPNQGRTPVDSMFYDHEKAERYNKEAANKLKLLSQTRRQNRVVDHPNYHNFSYRQAQAFLANQPRGSVVVRPSSKGDDHLAVTWKVDDDVYQNIHVLELDKESDYSLGRVLRIEGMGSYSDLDELIVNHVKPMVNMIELMMNHEKYKGADEEDLHRYLTNWSLANPSRSVYAFGLNKQRPGYFNLSFKANRDAAIQTWPVKVVPWAFKLGQADQLADMAALCNAFKTQYTTQASMARSGRTPAHHGGRTPAGGMTPGGARTPFGRTPMPMPMPMPMPIAAGGGWGTPMNISATPNPYQVYGARAPPPPMQPPPPPRAPPGAPPMQPPMQPPGMAPGPPPSFPRAPPPGPPPQPASAAGNRPPAGMHPDRFAQSEFRSGWQ